MNLRTNTGLVPANEQRRIDAAARAVPVLRALFARGTPMSQNLALVGRLRLDHPDDTLAELGQRVTPPLSKDTISGRLRRLLQAARAR